MTRLVALSLMILTFLTFVTFEVECTALRTGRIIKAKGNKEPKANISKIPKRTKQPKAPKTTKLPKAPTTSNPVPPDTLVTPSPIPATTPAQTSNEGEAATVAVLDPTSDPTSAPIPAVTSAPIPAPIPATTPAVTSAPSPAPTPAPTPAFCSLYVDLYHEEGQAVSNFGLYNSINIYKSGESEVCAIPNQSTTVFSTDWGCTVAGEAWLYYNEYYYAYNENLFATAAVSATADAVYDISITKEQFTGVADYVEQPPSPGQTPAFATFDLYIDDILVCRKQKGWGSSTDFTVTVENCALLSC